MYSTRLHVYTRASLTDILARIFARKSARVVQVGGQVGEDRRACSARDKMNARAAARRLPRAEVGEDVRVADGVGVGPMEFQLISIPRSDCSPRVRARSHCRFSRALPDSDNDNASK